jgi:hypothetical protein
MFSGSGHGDAERGRGATQDALAPDRNCCQRAAMRLLLFPVLILTACGPATEPAAPSAAPAAPAGEPQPRLAADVKPGPDDVPYQGLGWDGARLMLKDAATGAEKPFTGVTTRFSKTGQLTARYEVKDGLYHGLVEEWYDNGHQLTRTSYLHGRHEGDNVYWNRDGTLQSLKVWKDDVKVSETRGRQP